MTKSEIEQAIKNGESVWVANKYCIPYEVNLTNNYYAGIADDKESLMVLYDIELNDYLEYVFETKEKAQHYHDHANVERVETLPFLTWEEFKNGKNITFKAKDGHEFLLKAKQESIYLWWLDTNNIWTSWDLTEENFYKVYDECVKLFKGENDE